MVLRVLMCSPPSDGTHSQTLSANTTACFFFNTGFLSSVMAITQRGSLSAIAVAATLSCNVDTACDLS